jgi:Flp pilus assembly protein TadG
MKSRRGKSGQVAVFLVLLLAGLALLFALNIDIFISSRSKTRLQNAADASAIMMAKWQGIALNLIGELNLAHLAAVCQSNENAVAGIVELQRKIAFIAPTVGLDNANRIACNNGVGQSWEMKSIMGMVAAHTPDDYRRMLEEVMRTPVRIGIDNAAFIRAGIQDPRLDPDFYEAVKSRNFAELCRRFGGCRHHLPDIPGGVPDLEEVLNPGVNPYFGNPGIGWENGSGYIAYAYDFETLARECGVDAITADGIISCANLLSAYPWCVLDRNEWREWTEFDYSTFPSVAPVKDEYYVSGGSTTVRVEGEVALAAAAGVTNAIAGKSAAKVFGSYRGRRLTDAPGRLVVPAFSFVRLVPYAPGAAGRYGMASLDHVRSLMGLLGTSSGNGMNDYRNLLEFYRSNEFRDVAEKWYSSHAHDEVCCPPQPPGGEKAGGSPYGI